MGLGSRFIEFHEYLLHVWENIRHSAKSEMAQI